MYSSKSLNLSSSSSTDLYSCNSESDISDICQIDGNITQSDEKQSEYYNEGIQIPVHISEHRKRMDNNYEARIPIRKTLKRNNTVLQAIDLPIVMNINPRSIYYKADEFKILLEQYEADVVTISESWERDNFSL